MIQIKKKALVLFYGLFCVFNSLSAQVTVESGSIFNKVSNFISSIPGSTGDDYILPTNAEINNWNNIITDLINADFVPAASTANSLGYDLIEFSDTTTSPHQIYYILSPNSSNHWGFYIFNPNYCRTLVIQSPHPKNDFNTGKEGVHVFKETKALFFCLSGTHRCNSAQFSSCSGSTTACSSNSENFRLSDLAHNDNSIFQKTTEVLFNTFNDSYFIQLHGFAHDPGEPYLILSNGTQQTPNNDYLVDFRNAILIEDSTLTAVVAHVDLAWTSLRGFSNTQGRLINQSANFCDSNAISTNGRFFHIEQEKTKLRNDITGWTKVSNALSNTFSCQTLSVENNVLHRNVLTIYPNPTSDKFIIESIKIEPEEINVLSILGSNVNSSVETTRLSDTKILLDVSKLPTGFYVIKSQNTANKVYKK